MDTKFYKHQLIDWDYMQGQTVMEGLIAKFQKCGLYEFMGQMTYFNELTVKQFLATAEISTTLYVHIVGVHIVMVKHAPTTPSVIPCRRILSILSKL
jgi:hypothetical protein